MKNAEAAVLVEQIERLVREHVEATERAAEAALARAFSLARSSRSSGRKRPPSKAAARRTSGGTIGGRRSAAEIAALCERLCEAVHAEPGETMTRLARLVGATPRELARPMTMLRRVGRVRSVGQRHQTRYFPAVPESSGRAR